LNLPLFLALHVDVVDCAGCGLDSRRPIFDSDRYFSHCFHIMEAPWPVQLSVKSIPWTISLGAKPLGVCVWPVNQLRLALRLLGTAPIAPYLFHGGVCTYSQDYFNLDALQKLDVVFD
jgi:hypothetical protein